MEISKYIEVYRGTRGLYVQVTRFGKYEDNQALVRVTGFDHPWSEHIFLCKTTVNGSELKVSYSTSIDGKDYELMRTSREHGQIWLKGNFQFDMVYQDTIVSDMIGRNDLLNDYNNSASKTNPRK